VSDFLRSRIEKLLPRSESPYSLNAMRGGFAFALQRFADVS
jgi:hypothetical protein